MPFLIGILKNNIMKITYFKDTDTLLVNFNNNEITDTRDLNENVLIETDKNGNIVSMTIEHAQQQVRLPISPLTRWKNQERFKMT